MVLVHVNWARSDGWAELKSVFLLVELAVGGWSLSISCLMKNHGHTSAPVVGSTLDVLFAKLIVLYFLDSDCVHMSLNRSLRWC